MADQYGYPIVDIYVDAVPPPAPVPLVSGMTSNSVSFSWAAVADQGDGAGQDYFEAGGVTYTSWLTLNGGSPYGKQTTSQPVTVTAGNLQQSDTACVYVTASDRLGNVSPAGSYCASPLTPPPMPAIPSGKYSVAANPASAGLAGLPIWFWLNPSPATLQWRYYPKGAGPYYTITAVPSSVAWSFGDGNGMSQNAPSGFGQAYPTASSINHIYEVQSQTGYTIGANVTYQMSWTYTTGPSTFGPYGGPSEAGGASPLVYPVMQAQPQLSSVG